MKELYELKSNLVDELKDSGKKGKLSSGELSVVDTLAHTVKNLCKIIEDDDGYSGRWDDGRSYRRDSMGRYSREGYSRNDLSDKLRDLMNDVSDDRTRMEIKRLIDKM